MFAPYLDELPSEYTNVIAPVRGGFGSGDDATSTADESKSGVRWTLRAWSASSALTSST